MEICTTCTTIIPGSLFFFEFGVCVCVYRCMYMVYFAVHTYTSTSILNRKVMSILTKFYIFGYDIHARIQLSSSSTKRKLQPSNIYIYKIKSNETDRRCFRNNQTNGPTILLRQQQHKWEKKKRRRKNKKWIINWFGYIMYIYKI